MNSYRRLTSVLCVSLVLIIFTSGHVLLRVHRAKATATVRAIQARGTVSLHAAGRGNPWINLRDGRDLPTTYTGAADLEQSLEQNLARPLALAADDFDEDGVPDLISSYAGSGGGILTLHRGNVDSIFPNSPEARQRRATGTFTDSPFLPQAHVFAVPEAPDFLGTGDFDNDGHWDVVAAARGSNVLYLLPGDGRGGLGRAQRIDLPGRVTALVAGEINRRDGLADIVVGIAGANGPEALVFESPEGALKGQPEAIALPAEAAALALGQLDDDYAIDLAVAAGNELVIVHGRDRKLSLDEFSRAEVPQASISRTSFPFAITSMTIGDFTGSHQMEVALLSADGVVHLVKERATPSIGQASERAITGQSETLAAGSWPQATRLVCARVSGLPRNDLVVVDSVNRQLHILVAAPTNDAITQGREDTGSSVTSPTSRVSVSLDVEGEPVAVLPMRLNADALNDLVILKGGLSGLTAALTAPLATFVVNSTGDDGDCDYDDGVCSTGTKDQTGKCILTGQCTLRAAIQQANASPGADTIVFAVSSIRPSGPMQRIVGPLTIDGTTQPAGRVELSEEGLNITGSTTVRGLVINRCNGNGILLDSTGGNVIEGNFIGTDITGTINLGNGTGVAIDTTYNFIRGRPTDNANNLIGGTTAAARNLISGNDVGINISAQAPGGNVTGNLVQGNYIGTNAAGTTALGNSVWGVAVVYGASGNTIGGTAIGARNLISGNGVMGFFGSFGVLIFGSGARGNLVQGNYIGTSAAGTSAVGNIGTGVGISNEVTDNTIGGTATGARNVISANTQGGLAVFGGVTGSQIQGNYIGTNAAGSAALGNRFFGMFITEASANTVGGAVSNAGNIIAFNENAGLAVVPQATNNTILRNSIFSNTGLGIDLGDDGGVTPNDPGDNDSGANGLQNFPVLTSVASSSTSTTIQGTLNSKSNSSFTLEFFSNTACDPSGYGEGEKFIGSMAVTTDSIGNASFNITFPTPVPSNQFITTTATDSSGNTSEFSRCIREGGVPACTYSIFPLSQSFPASGGTGSVDVTAMSGCSWTAVSRDTWITITSGSSVSGNGRVTYSVGPNTSAFPRTGTMLIAGIIFTVTQAGAPSPCTYGIAPLSQFFTPSGGIGSVNVTAPLTCSWTACSQEGWLTITSGSSGSGNGILNYSVAPNNSPVSRTGVLTIASLTFVVTQAGTSGDFTLVALPNAVAPGTPLTVFWTAPSGRSTTDVIGFYRVGDPNTNLLSRLNTQGAASGSFTISASLQVGSYEFRYLPGNGPTEVARSNVVTVSPGGICEYCFTVTSLSFTTNGGTGSVNVRTPSDCLWTAVSNANWITITSGSSGSGNGTVSYMVAANSDTNPRTGTLLIAGHTFTVTQAGSAAQIEIIPANPTTNDQISIKLSGTWSSTCIPQNPQVTFLNNEVRINTSNPGQICGSGFTPWNLTVPIGKLSAGTYQVIVTHSSPGGQAELGRKSFTVTQAGAPCPIVSSLSPTSGAVGTTVIIIGSNFTGVNAVKFSNNVSAPFFTVNTDTQITTAMPSGAVTGPITISKPGCTDVQSGTFTLVNSKLFDQGAWVVNGATDTAMDRQDIKVSVEGRSVGTFSELTFFYKIQASDVPQIFSVKGSGALRPALPPPGAFGATFYATGYWDCEQQKLIQNLKILEADIKPDPGNPNLLRLTGKASNLSSLEATDFTLLFSPPTQESVKVQVSYTLVATRDFCLDQSRQVQHEGFRIARIASNFLSPQIHDNDQAAYADSRGTVVRTDLRNENGFIFTAPFPPFPMGAPKLFLGHSDAQPRNTPTLSIQFSEPGPAGITPQGFVTNSSDRNADNVDLWGNWDNAKPQYAAGETVGRFAYSLEAIPPGPFTVPALPTVITGAASATSSTSATLSGSVNPNGSTTSIAFEWGTSSTLASFNTTQVQTVGSGTTSVTVNESLSGLAAGTNYYHRLAGTNSAGTAKGSILSFTTPNPFPTPTSLSPNAASAGGAAFTLTVNGTNFVNGSTVRWNGAGRNTSFVSSTQLTAAITAADIATAGAASVTVANPAPGGGVSNALTFTITQPACTYSIAPTSQSFGANGGNGSVNVTALNGCNWVAVSNVSWITLSGSVNFMTNFSFPSSVTINGHHIHEAPAGVNGSVRIDTGLSGANTIVSPTGNGTINRTAFLVEPAVLQRLLTNPSGFYVNLHTSDNPGGALRGQVNQFDQALTSTVPLSSANEVPPISNLNATGTTILTVDLTQSSTGTGTVSFSVAPNPSPSPRASTLTIAGQTFTINQSGASSCPTVSGISPTSGAVSTNMTITGTNLTGLTAVKFSNNVTATITFNSDTQITATVPSGAVTGPISISKPGCADVQTGTFTVIPPPTLALSFSGKIRDRVGAGETALSPDGFADGTFTATLPAGSGTRTITSLDLSRSGGGRWNTIPGDGLWVLGVASSLDGALFNSSTGTVNFTVSSGGSFTLFASDNNNSLFNPGASFTLTVNFADGASGSATVTVPASPLTLSFNGKIRDRVGPGETALNPDGFADGTFTVTLPAGSGNRTVTSLDLSRSGGGRWNTTPGDGLWVLGAADSLDAPLFDNTTGTVNFNVSGGGSFILFASDNDNLFNPGASFTLTVNFADGTSGTASVTVPTSPLTLSFNGKVRDRVGPGETALNPDGFADGTFTVTLPAGSGTRTITSLDLSRSGGGRWNTTPSDGLWVVGAASSLDAPLFNSATGTVSFSISSGGSFVLFVSDNNNSLFNSGDSFTLTVSFADGTTATASATVTTSSARASNYSTPTQYAEEDNVNASFSVRIGLSVIEATTLTVEGQLFYAGLAPGFVGLDQIDVAIPRRLSGAVK